MTTLTVQLPESLHERIEELARQDGISLNQFLATAAAEKMSALLTEDYLRSEAKLGNREDFQRAMSNVPDVPPEPGDELPDSALTR